MKDIILAQLYQLVAEEAMFGIVVFDQDGACLFSNKMAAQLLGSETPHRDEMQPPAERPPFKSFSKDLLKHDGLYQDILVRNPTQNSFIANIGVKSLEVNGTVTHLLMLQDVTLQKKMQREITAKQNEINNAFEELLNQNRQLKELDLAKNRFIALTTHELRTPLSAMCASAEILKLKLYDTPEQMQEFVDMIYDQGQHLQELVNDILDFAKIQAGKMDFFIEEKPLVAFTEKVLRSYESMAEQNQISVAFELPEIEINAYFDELRLRQILSNIMNNAIKYNRPKGHVRVYFSQDQDVVRVHVEDTGKGISPENYSKVFNEFETIGQTANHHKGTGLGMPISRKLTEGMGGKLLFSSEEGVGSTFWVEIPRHRVLDEALYQKRLVA